MIDIEASNPEAEAIAERMAALIPDQQTLDQVLAEAGTDAKRTVIMAYVGPFLAFPPETSTPIGDCPKCGLRRGTVLAHECTSAFYE